MPGELDELPASNSAKWTVSQVPHTIDSALRNTYIIILSLLQSGSSICDGSRRTV